MTPRTRPRRAAGLVVPWLLLLIALSACSATSGVATIDGADDPSASPSASAAPEDPEEAMFAFAECMREQGIDMPDPVIRRFDASGGGGGGTINENADPGGGPAFDPFSEEFQAAEEACQEHLEGLGALEEGEGPQLSAEEEEAFLAFAECMREQGIDMPDFRGGEGGVVRIGPGEGSEPGFDPRSEEFQAAEEACSEHLDALPMPGDEEVAP
jgi:hypothetical protein